MDELKLIKRRKKAFNDNNEIGIINACTNLANLYLERSQYDFAIDEFTVIADIYKKQNKKLEYAVVNRGIGEAYLGLHKFDDALSHLKIYYETVKELNNKIEEQRALATIGHTHLTSYLESTEQPPDKNKLNSANKFFFKSLNVCESLSGEISKVEIADMQARLFSNLGLVQDSLGNFEKACELINKSITLCKANDLYEQLERGYTALASVYEKRGENKTALQQYNFAVETAKKLRDKPILLATAFLSKSEILVKLGDFQGAKNTLVKAYKLKIPNAKERTNIEKNLRTVASMCQNEDKLLTTKDTDYPTLKELYEKMGDGACDLKNYDKAINYYKKMLETGIKAGLSDNDLATCYYSLAETYKDNGQYQEAVNNYEKEMDLCESLKDKLNTLSKIADTKETAESPLSEIQTVYMRATDLCRRENNSHEEGRMLKRFILYLRRQNKHSEAFKYQQELDKLDYNTSDSEGESSDAQSSSVIGGDINLDDITDVSDESDSEQVSSKSRRRTKNFLVKRNAKGETALHTACIQKKINVVKHLLDQGHPVNVRDNCGWLPLHEACNRGYVDIVRLLLEKGATINDRGGKGCEGITPLHDAASNGHLEVVQLLLSKGANALAKTDNEETVLSFLTKWRSDKLLNDENEALYQSIIDQIQQALEKTGQNNEEQTNTANSSDALRTSFEDNRRSITVGLEDEDSMEATNSYAEDYRSVMENLRHKSERKSPRKSIASTMTKRSALIAAENVVDDWLEDDLGKSYKKRKTNSPFKKTDSPSKSERSYTSSRSTKSTPNKRYSDFVVDVDDSENVSIDLEDSYYDPHNTPSTSKVEKTQSPTKNVFKKRKYQAKLTSFGHTRTYVEADSTCSPNRNKKSSNVDLGIKTLPKIRSFDQPQPVIDPTLSVDVRINEKLYRVPVLSSQVNTHTIKWLANEAASRYARKEYLIPTLELETKNGAILADDDLISLLFPMGATQAEEIQARIVKWDIPPLINRYKEVCQDVSIEPDGTLCQILQEFSVVLDLSDKGLRGSTLAPLCKVLNRQTNLLELHLSGNFLTNDCVQFLASSIPSLTNMYKLNLNCTSLLSEHLRILVEKLSTESSHKLTDLDLSDNMIGDQAFESLASLTRGFKLKRLNLSCNKFTKDLFTYNFNKDVSLNLDEIEEFDISDNGFSNDGLIKILSWLKPKNLKKLDVSRNCISHGFVRELLMTWGEIDELKLVSLKMSRCYVHDSDLFDLLRMSSSLETLDLSYNNELTSISLRRLLQCDPLISLDLYGCNNIFKYFTELSKYYIVPNEEKSKTIKLSVDFQEHQEESEYLINMWKDFYGSRAVLEQSYQLLYLSVSK